MKKKILIVDDERSIVDTITYALETEGFEYVWCESGGKALSFLEKDFFDFIVLDIGLPDIDGFELFKKIRQKLPTPVMFLTARSDVVDRVVGLELGADDYLVKPFSPRELTARIKTILRRSKDQQLKDTQERVIDSERNVQSFLFKHDKEKCSITFKNIALDLSRYEYLLLAFLIEHADRVYSRAELMEYVWDVPESSLDRTVDTHIKTIRSKLKAIDPDGEPIITHRGLGYSLKATL